MNTPRDSDPIAVEMWRRSLRGVALVAALFCLVLSTLVLANYVQLKTADPLNSPALGQLMVRTVTTPNDKTLQEEVRALDLLARQAYFTRQAQILTGGYLLLGAAIVLLVAFKALAALQPRPVPRQAGSGGLADPWVAAVLARKWIAVAGLGIVVLSIAIALSYRPSLKTAPVPAAATAVSPASQSPAVPRPVAPRPDTLPEGPAADFATAAEMAANWPAFRGPGGNAVAGEGKYPVDWDAKTGRNILWKTEIPRSGQNSPVVWEKRVYLTGADKAVREVFAFDADTGQLVWRSEVKGVPGSPAEPPEVSEDTGFAAPTVATDGRRLFAIFANGDLACLTLAGKPLWTKNFGLPQNHYGHASSLMTFESTLLVQYDHAGGGRLLALDAATGNVRWEKARDLGMSWATPIVANTGQRTEVILNAVPRVVSYDARSGAELWSCECMSGEVASSPAYADGLAFVANQYACLAAIRVADGKLAWKNEDAELPDVASPLTAAKYLFLAASSGTVTCFEAKTGTVFWKHEFAKGFYASPVLAGENIYLLDMGGTAQIVKAAAAFALVGTAALDERVVCTPALAAGRIYIRGEKNLFCLGTRQNP